MSAALSGAAGALAAAAMKRVIHHVALAPVARDGVAVAKAAVAAPDRASPAASPLGVGERRAAHVASAAMVGIDQQVGLAAVVPVGVAVAKALVTYIQRAHARVTQQQLAGAQQGERRGQQAPFKASPGHRRLSPARSRSPGPTGDPAPPARHVASPRTNPRSLFCPPDRVARDAVRPGSRPGLRSPGTPPPPGPCLWPTARAPARSAPRRWGPNGLPRDTPPKPLASWKRPAGRFR